MTNEQARIDEEDIRLTTGFADVFTAIVLVLAGTLLGAISGVLTVIAAFALGVPVVRNRQFAAASSTLAIGVALGTIGFTAALDTVSLLIAAGACALFWRIYRVPLALALAWIGVVGFVLGLGHGGLISTLDAFNLDSTVASLGLLGGTVLFGVAMWYDAHDRTRQTRLSDVAFWLHLVAAPMMVHSLFASQNANPFSGEPVNAGWVLGTFAVLTLVSLVIDRRPLLVSSFGYLLAATAALLSDPASKADWSQRFEHASLAPLLVGVLALVLAAAWSPLRASLLGLLPAAIVARVPPPASPSAPGAATRAAPADLPPAEKEPLRLVLGFNDIFVSLGSSMLFFGSFALGYFLIKPALLAAQTARAPEQLLMGMLPWLVLALPALSLWLVAEYFVRHRRMAWPAITTALWFNVTAWLTGIMLGWRLVLSQTPALLARGADRYAQYPYHPPAPEAGVTAGAIYLACTIAITGNLLFWWRQRTPISFSLAVASLLPLLFVQRLVDGLNPAGFASKTYDGAWWAPYLLPFGCAVFTLAMVWDRSDPDRRTQRADTAFWLHLLAALILIPALSALAMDTAHAGTLIMLGFAGLLVLCLGIDRRGPLAIALPYVLKVLSSDHHAAGGAVLPLIFALALLALVLQWDRVRGWMLGRLGLSPA